MAVMISSPLAKETHWMATYVAIGSGWLSIFILIVLFLVVVFELA